LATAQSEFLGNILDNLNPRVSMRLVPLESEGDQIKDGPLAHSGGKGLFTNTIERAVLDETADIAVHSMKDLPTELTMGLIIVATPKRAPVHDVLISRDADTIDDLPEGAKVGTCSPRRAAQLLRLRPDLNIVPLRGNVDTRLKKVHDTKEVDATLLAAAGLLRLGMTEHCQKPIPVDQIMPAAAQGALAVQCRVDDHITVRRCMPLNDAACGITVNAEREVVGALDAGCYSPIAATAEQVGLHELRVRARVLSLDGQTCVEADITGPTKRMRGICREVIDSLKNQGAEDILAQAEAEGAKAASA
jgi:hydroxymethylbilane synthase